ncbi:MAG: sodium-dependent transporter [Phycisphaerae bacterium]|nr:sodium-dependent transporter [Phycisphaerae bacterium]
MAEQLLEEQRENWGSRPGFVLAAIGSAVGLGNLWRFPYEAYNNGGGAFLIPYAIAMIVIGIPMLILEFSLGHMTQRAAPEAYGHLKPKWRWLGWWPICMSLVIICYYSVVLAWSVNYLAYSFNLSWGDNAVAFFLKEHLNYHAEYWSLGGIQWHVVLALGAVWLGMYLCIFKGVKLVSKIVLWTVPLPWLMLVIIIIRGLTLEGAVSGLEYYLEPDWAQLLRPKVWQTAFGQVFFSMTLAFGVMITYASFLHRKSDINNNALIVGLSDVGTSFAAGLAVFSVVGFLALQTTTANAKIMSVEASKLPEVQAAVNAQQAKGLTGEKLLAMEPTPANAAKFKLSPPQFRKLQEGVRTKKLDISKLNVTPDKVIGTGGGGLAFMTFPTALKLLPWANFFAIIFFVALMLLGIDSAFSMLEAGLASIVDKTHWPRSRVLPVICVLGFLAGLVFCTRSGDPWLTTLDHYVNSYFGVLAIGLIECLALGWIFDIKKLRAHANERSDWQIGKWWEWNIKIVIPVILVVITTWTLYSDLTGSGGDGDKFMFVKEGRPVWHNILGGSFVLLLPVVAVVIAFVGRNRLRARAQTE